MIYLILEYPETQTENPLKVTQRGSARMKARMGLISWLVLDQSLCFISVKDYALKVIPGRNSMTWKWERIWAALQPGFLIHPHQSTAAWLLGSCRGRHAVYRGHCDLELFLPFSSLLFPFHLRKEFCFYHDTMVTKGYHVWNFIH